MMLRNCSGVCNCDCAVTVAFNAWPGTAGAVTYPDMRLCIYHDAHLVEAQDWAAGQGQPVLKGFTEPSCSRRRVAGGPQLLAERELDQRWARNMMLNKWLEYCAERGHRFSTATRVTAAD